MAERAGGVKRSSQLAFRRRLTIVRRLLRGPATRDELIAVVRETLGDDAYPTIDRSALKHDLDRLRSEYGCRIVLRRSPRAYVLEDPGDLAMLTLSEAALDGLRALTVAATLGVDHRGVRELLDSVVRMLPAGQRGQVAAAAGLAPARPATAERDLHRATLATVRRAVAERRELEFDYCDAEDGDTPRRHRVAPYDVSACADGVISLDATLIEVSPPGEETPLEARRYRVDQIVAGTARGLARSIPDERPRPQVFRLRYRLHRRVVRRGEVVALFTGATIAYHDDGGATVAAEVTNLRQACRALLPYGDACEVQEPPELALLIRTAAEGLLRLYRPSDEGGDHGERTLERG